MSKNWLVATDVEEGQKVTCKGLIYKCRNNYFMNSKGELVDTVRMVPLKRKSCPGCEKCGGTEEFLSESMANEEYPVTSGLEADKEYKLIAYKTYQGGGFDPAEYDEWALQFVPAES